jgi:RNA polymerase sigma factor (sigma-70 family)
MSHSSDQLVLDAYDTYADAIFRHCLFRVRDRERAKDLMHDTFLRALEAQRKGADIQNMRAFLYRIAHNLIIDAYRRDHGDASLEELEETVGFDPPDASQSPARDFAGTEVLEKLQHVDEPYRSAVILRFVDGLEPSDISELLGVSANVVSVRIHRGLKRLGALLHAQP